jgi:hypothetical protein
MMLNALFKAIPSIALAVLTTACSDPLICTEPGVRSVVVNVRDALTGQPAAYQARLIMSSDTRVDTITDLVSAAESLVATEVWSHVGPGVYTVTVEKDGYLPWTTEGVRVQATPNGCSVSTVHLDANLSPLESEGLQ